MSAHRAKRAPARHHLSGPAGPVFGPACARRATYRLSDHPGKQGYGGNSATPCATAHGAHSATSTSPSRFVESRRVITACLSHTPMSSGCDLAQEQPQSRWAQTGAMRQPASTARTAGSLASLCNASVVAAAVRSAHSATTAAAASQAATNCRTGLSPSPLTTTSSHPWSGVTTLSCGCSGDR